MENHLIAGAKVDIEEDFASEPRLDMFFLLQQKIENRKKCNSQTLILEVDGPTHFLRDIDSAEVSTRADGLTAFSSRLLEKCGFKVVRIPYFDASEANIRSLAKYLLKH